MENKKEIYIAGGCYWGTEHFMRKIKGVLDTTVGFANGNVENPTYKQVCSEETGFAETVKVIYDANIAPLHFLLDLYYKIIDPTSIDKQGEDAGVQYRTGIYYTNNEDKAIIENSIKDLQKNYDKPIAIQVEPLRNFYAAEEEHQDYLMKNPNGYCHVNLSMFPIAENAEYNG
ncbi:MAG: peptide-methionine (S)-S-oxide reductase MsrA [Oscillospiraceae bacterium]